MTVRVKPRVCAQVGGEVALLSECLAGVMFLARVCAQVGGELALLRECFGADVAAVGLLPRVCALGGEVALHSERQGADVAGAWLLPRVCAQAPGEAAPLPAID